MKIEVIKHFGAKVDGALVQVIKTGAVKKLTRKKITNKEGIVNFGKLSWKPLFIKIYWKNILVEKIIDNPPKNITVKLPSFLGVRIKRIRVKKEFYCHYCLRTTYSPLNRFQCKYCNEWSCEKHRIPENHNCMYTGKSLRKEYRMQYSKGKSKILHK